MVQSTFVLALTLCLLAGQVPQSEAFLRVLGSAIEKIGSSLASGVGSLGSSLGKIGSSVDSHLGSLGSSLTNTIGKISSSITSGLGSLGTNISSGLSAIGGFISNITGSINKLSTAMTSNLSQLGKIGSTTVAKASPKNPNTTPNGLIKSSPPNLTSLSSAVTSSPPPNLTSLGSGITSSSSNLTSLGSAVTSSLPNPTSLGSGVEATAGILSVDQDGLSQTGAEMDAAVQTDATNLKSIISNLLLASLNYAYCQMAYVIVDIQDLSIFGREPIDWLHTTLSKISDTYNGLQVEGKPALAEDNCPPRCSDVPEYQQAWKEVGCAPRCDANADTMNGCILKTMAIFSKIQVGVKPYEDIQAEIHRMRGSRMR